MRFSLYVNYFVAIGGACLFLWHVSALLREIVSQKDAISGDNSTSANNWSAYQSLIMELRCMNRHSSIFQGNKIAHFVRFVHQ